MVADDDRKPAGSKDVEGSFRLPPVEQFVPRLSRCMPRGDFAVILPIATTVRLLVEQWFLVLVGNFVPRVSRCMPRGDIAVILPIATTVRLLVEQWTRFAG